MHRTFLLAILPFAAQGQTAPDARELLLHSGGPVLSANVVRISGTKRTETVGDSSPFGTRQDTFAFVIGKDGRARWETTVDGIRLQVWDGANVWDYRPTSKLYLKDTAKSAPDAEPIAVLKYGRTPANIVSAKVEREAELGSGGRPTLYYVIRADYAGAPNNPGARNAVRTVWITQDKSNVVLRDTWEFERPYGSNPKIRQTFSYGSIKWSEAAGENDFVFDPPKGSRQMPLGALPDLREGLYRVGNGVTAPAIVSKVEPSYTEKARRAKHQGTVLLYVEVDPAGKATNIIVLRPLGLGLDENAIKAVRKWVFKPATKDGKPVSVAAQIEVSFHLL